MNGKEIISLITLLLAIFCITLCSGCATRPVVITTDESIVSSQIGVAKLKAVNDGLRDLLQVYDRQFKRQIERAVGGIDEALDRLDEYDDFVQELILRIRNLELESRIGKGESTGKE